MNTNKGKNIALITGANAGIGLELTRKLLAEGWEVVALNRSAFPAEDARIQQAVHAGRLRLYKVADLADYAALRRTLEEIKEAEARIDVLFNNAGGSFNELTYSKQGRESHYEIMTVVPYLILMELKGLLMKSRLKTVINTSSSAFAFTRAFSLELLERPKTFRKLIGPYANAKLALSLWTQAIAPNLAQDGIKIRSVDPGGNNTLRKGKKSGLPFPVNLLMKLFFPAPSRGAELLHAGAFGEHRNETGVFVSKGRITDLKFGDQAQAILKRIDGIYKHEFLNQSTHS